ncbi:MAG: polysaccharide deacetylase family protein [Clostridia bacterium]|nr:polysaccharide deacetylase family protein [Clostridia bacterium]
MKWRQAILLSCASLLLGVMLAGCGTGSNTTTPTSSDASGSAIVPEGSATENTAEPPSTELETSLPQGDKYMAITFDDGPTGNEGGRTERLLDELKERNVHATFFLCGYRVKDFHSMMDRYLAEGHEVGNHTMDHIRLDTETDDGGYAQVSSTNELIASYTGKAPTLIRPTGGAYNDAVIASMKELGLPIILWNIDSLDWKYHDDADVIRQRIIDNARDGAIVLEHDLYETTVEGVLAAIDELQEQGYAFVTVSELAEIKGVTLEPGKVYTGFTQDDVVIDHGSNFS